MPYIQFCQGCEAAPESIFRQKNGLRHGVWRMRADAIARRSLGGGRAQRQHRAAGVPSRQAGDRGRGGLDAACRPIKPPQDGRRQGALPGTLPAKATKVKGVAAGCRRLATLLRGAQGRGRRRGAHLGGTLPPAGPRRPAALPGARHAGGAAAAARPQHVRYRPFASTLLADAMALLQASAAS